MASTTSLAPVGLEAVIITDSLEKRPGRLPDHERENRALFELMQQLANSPEDILQNLAETAMTLCQAGSAGISIEEKGTLFRWHGLAGQLASHRWGTTPRNFSPCGTVLDQNATLLMYHLERFYPYFAEVKPTIVEALLIPFAVDGKIIGTVWVVTHDEKRKFDAEDKRIIGNLAKFAAVAYQARMASDAANNADRRKDEFLAMLGHELRNALFPLKNATTYLAENGSSDIDSQHATALLVRQLKHMNRLIDDLLDASRITQGKIELRKARLELSAVIQNALETCRPVMDASNHDVSVSLPPGHVYINADPDRIAQVLHNLLMNAAKYTGVKGTIRLMASVEGDEAVIRLRDNGIGIPPDRLHTIFDLFSQVDASAERSHGGLGVGLALVKYLVEAHAGSIKASSAGLDQGSEFVVRLPIAAAVEGVSSPAFSSPAKTNVPTRSLRILIADDNQDSADSLAMLLRIGGHEVLTAYDGRSALATAPEFQPHVVLSDLGMPGMNGYEMARELRELDATRNCVLVAVTGYAQADDGKRIETAGFNHHLIKPVELEALEALLLSIDPNAPVQLSMI